MDLFEQYYRDELNYLRLLGKQRANEVPSQLSFLNDNSDPDVERLFEGCAFLTASLRQKIDDGFPEVTQCLLFRGWSLGLIFLLNIMEFLKKRRGYAINITLK